MRNAPKDTINDGGRGCGRPLDLFLRSRATPRYGSRPWITTRYFAEQYTAKDAVS